MEPKNNFKQKVFSGLFFLLSFAFEPIWASGSVASTVDLSKGESRVEFLAVGKPSALKIRGTGGPLLGKVGISDQGVSGTIDMDLNTLDTGIGLRNTHMKEKYLQTSKFPRAQLSLKKVNLPSGWLKPGQKLEAVDFEGVLNLHGIEKPVFGKLNLNHDGKLIDGSAQFKLKISDFQIDIPSYAGIKVADEVDVQTFFKSPVEATN